MVADRIDGHPTALFERGIVVAEGAQDHGVAGPGRQHVVILHTHRVVATYAASGLQVEPIGAWGELDRLHGLVDNAAERLGHRHGPSSSFFDPASAHGDRQFYFPTAETCCATREEINQ